MKFCDAFLTAVNTVKKIRYLKCGAVWNAHRPLWERVTKLDGIPAAFPPKMYDNKRSR